MKKKQLKEFESVAFIALELLGKAVEMKKLQIEELKIKNNYPKYQAGGVVYKSEADWLKSRCGKVFPSGLKASGCPEPEKEFVIPKNGFTEWKEKLSADTPKEYLIPIGFKIEGKAISEDKGKSIASIIDILEEGVKNGTITGVKWDFGKGNSEGVVFKSTKDIHEEALENGLKTEKEYQTGSELTGDFKEGLWYKSVKGNSIQFNAKKGRGHGINEFGTIVSNVNWLNSYGNGEWRIATEKESQIAFAKIREND